VSDLLAAARATDASSCRWHIAVIARSYGVETFAFERDRPAASHARAFGLTWTSSLERRRAPHSDRRLQTTACAADTSP